MCSSPFVSGAGAAAVLALAGTAIAYDHSSQFTFEFNRPPDLAYAHAWAGVAGTVSEGVAVEYFVPGPIQEPDIAVDIINRVDSDFGSGTTYARASAGVSTDYQSASASATVDGAETRLNLSGGFYFERLRLDIRDKQPSKHVGYERLERFTAFLGGSSQAGANLTFLDADTDPVELLSVSASSIDEWRIESDSGSESSDHQTTTWSWFLGDPAIIHVVEAGGQILSRGVRGVTNAGVTYERGDVTVDGNGSATYLFPTPAIFTTADVNLEVFTEAVLPGDLNGDEAVDALDIDLLAARAADDPGVVDPLDLFDLDTDWDISFGTAVDTDSTLMIDLLLDTAYGDANLDGAVDLADFTALSGSFGGPGGWADGDFNGDGLVDLSDYTILAGNFGFTGGTGALMIPEPTTALMLTAGPLALLGRRRTVRR